MAINASFVSPPANAPYPIQNDLLSGYVGRMLDNINGWTVVLAIFLGLVLYDQCELLYQHVIGLLIDHVQIGTS